MDLKDRSTARRVGPGEGRPVRMPGAALVTCRVRSGQTGGAYSLFEVEVGPGSGETPHIQHREDECLYVLEGRFEFVGEEGELIAEKGATIYLPKGTLHAFGNVGEGVGRMLAIQTPGGSHERFVEEAGRPVAGWVAPPATQEPPDAWRLAAIGAEYVIEVAPPPWRTPGPPEEKTTKSKRNKERGIR